MPTSFVIKDKTGKQIDRIYANSADEATKIYKSKKANIPQKTVSEEQSMVGKAWDWANDPWLAKRDIKTGLGTGADALTNFGYEHIVRPMTSPLGIATTPFVFGKALPIAAKAVVAGAKLPYVAPAVGAAKKSQILKRIVNETKGLALTTGFPGTNLSFHGLSLAATNAMATPLREGGIIGGAIKSGKYLLSQKYAAKQLAKHRTEQAVIRGAPVTHTVNGVSVPMSWEEYARKSGVHIEAAGQAGAKSKDLPPFLTAGKYNPVGKVARIQEEVYDKPLFGEMVPAMKIDQFKRIVQNLEKTIVQPKYPIMNNQAKAKWFKQQMEPLAQIAGKTSNNFFGGLGDGSKWDKSALQPILLAPDWYERHVRMFGGTVKALANPKSLEGRAYRTFASNMAQTLGVMDVANKMISGHHLWENAPGKNFQIDTGRLDENGRRIYIDPTSGALDFVRLPTEVVHGMVKGKNLTQVLQIVQNRLSTVARTAMDMVGANYKPPVSRYQFPQKERMPGGGIRMVTRPPLLKQAEFALDDMIDNLTPGPFQVLEDYVHRAYKKPSERDDPRFSRDPAVSRQVALAKMFEFPIKAAKDPRPEILTRAEVKQQTRERAARRREKKRQVAQEKREGSR